MSNRETPPRISSPRRGVALHALRVGLVLTVIWLIRQEHVAFQAGQTRRDAVSITLDRVSKFYPGAVELAAPQTGRGSISVLDAAGEPLGYVVQTSPDADHVVGYSGPTNTLIAFDREDQVVGIDVISSGDTLEHVADVLESPRFLTALNDCAWDDLPARVVSVDAVSGATLTSLAILESVAQRLGSARPSLRFPTELTPAEVKEFFPAAVRLAARPRQPTVYDVYAADGNRLGAVLRTSPAADDEMGYQGPTDTLIVLDLDDRLAAVAVRSSYDNEPYVGYVREDEYFPGSFRGRSLEELAAFSPREAGVEGVSGATMTSMAIAYGLPKAAARAIAPPRHTARWVWSARDVGTVMVMAAALLITWTRLRGFRWARLLFQLTLVGYFGFLNGDLLSQALLVGWSQSGVPWRLAPGLVLLTAVALLVPACSKRQPYCHHICPFGAAQQLIRNRLPWRVGLPPWLAAAGKLIPALLLVLVVLTAMLHWPLNLAGLEPFDAFLFWIAGGAAIAVALVGLAVSAFVPMAYCRFGCPTGAMLNYLRFHGRSDRVSRRDLVAVMLVVLAVAIRVF